ncbi:hydroxysteroid dehydrogenase-like protein 2 [Sycon ciliatum]|uniref:hydroxysteroid dehydrogenase-like protein 2 n=1 Tax=Sycon ciliatum TaxID=27933 RepID=UPI0031F6065B
MINTGKLAGRTAFITGASRGIGKAIALKIARDGGNVVIAAKTVKPHPKLAGTIYTAAKEIEEAGGKCLPCEVNIRDEAAVELAVHKAVQTFGGIDIVINNASAISLTGTQETPMKRFDLMFGVNVRGTYCTSQACMPYLLNGKNPHVLNISPPLSMRPHWFKNHVAYTMAKYGMSMCVLGMSEEYKAKGVAVNALWPKTAINTAAMEMLGGEQTLEQCRTVDIMADAAYAILTKNSRDNTGNFYIDEAVLRECGVENFDHYSVKPGATLMPDFFLDDDAIALAEMGRKRMKAQQEVPEEVAAEQHQTTTDTPSESTPVSEVFDSMRSALNEEMVSRVGGVFSFEVSGKHEGTWYVDLKNGAGAIGQGAPVGDEVDVVMKMSSDTFVQLFTGQTQTVKAYMMGKLKIKGNMGMAMKLDKQLSRIIKSKL